MKERFKLTKYGESITEESAANGEADETWTEIDHVPATLREVVDAFRECTELSSWPLTRADIRRLKYARGLWGTIEATQDMHTGAYVGYSVHIEAISGEDVTGRDMARVLYLAGLVKH